MGFALISKGTVQKLQFLDSPVSLDLSCKQLVQAFYKVGGVF